MPSLTLSCLSSPNARRVARIAIALVLAGGAGGAASVAWTPASAHGQPAGDTGTAGTRRPATSTPTPTATASPAPTPEPTVVIESPLDGQTTPDRSLVVRGHAPSAPRGGDTLISVLVDGREFDVASERGGAFAVPVTVALGANTIAATAQLDTPDGGERNL